MKKLLILALSALMILSVTAISMASTVSFSGYVRTGYDWAAGTAADSAAVQGQDGKVKLKADAKISDTLTATITSENITGITEGYFTLKSGSTTLKVGTFDYNVKDNVDVLNGIFGGNDLDNNLSSFLATYNFTPAVSASIYGSQAYSNAYASVNASGATVWNDNKGYYGASFAYAGPVFGADVYYVTPASQEYAYGAVTAVNAYVGSAFKAYVHYGTTTFTNAGTDVDYKSQIVGLRLTQGAFMAEVEYDLNKGLNDLAQRNALGFKTTYKFASGLTAEYVRQIADGNKTMSFDGTANAFYGNVSRLRLIANF